MHSFRIITIAICVVTAIGLLAWDFCCMFNKETGDTISEVVRQANKGSGGLVALIMLALWMHFFLDWLLPASWK